MAAIEEMKKLKELLTKKVADLENQKQL